MAYSSVLIKFAAWNCNTLEMCRCHSCASLRVDQVTGQRTNPFDALLPKIFHSKYSAVSSDWLKLNPPAYRRWPRLRSFGMTHIRISDLISLGRIMENQVNRWLLSQSGLVGSFNASWSEWSRIIDPDPDHPIGMYPKFGRRGQYTVALIVYCPSSLVSSQISHQSTKFPSELKNSFYGYSETIND